ncbi:MAG: hypothetical protein U5K79_05110 [Cyclobacteriaceae bacterium]|nr:hypothetical protein [Cyclobacteriaceae bacterium]
MDLKITRKAIRDANNQTRLKKEHWNPYHYCEALTGLLYAVLVDEYELHRAGKPEPDALYEVGNESGSRYYYGHV